MRTASLLVAPLLISLYSAVGAVPVAWNTWSTSTTGSLDAGAGLVSVSFATANVRQLVPGATSWGPPSTFSDGSTVANAPVLANGVVRLVGGNNNLNTLTFSVPVTNPVISIWSLGRPTSSASFVFTNATPVFVAGGRSAEYGGSPLLVSGNTVSGFEGNGTVRFAGTYATLTWTNPQAEDWYGFNVGVSAVPEQVSWLTALLGMATVFAWRNRRRR